MIPTHEPWRRGARNSKERIILMEPIQVGLFCILPPVIAIGLALITKEVLSSLMLGILSGTLIYALNTGAGPISAVSSAFTIMAEEFSASMIIFLCLLGGLVAVISMAGGSRAYGEWAAKGVRSRKSAQFATGILGVLIFIDDYFNCLTVGTVMKPITDKYHISRAKLAYLIDATAAPVCIIAPRFVVGGQRNLQPAGRRQRRHGHVPVHHSLQFVRNPHHHHDSCAGCLPA